MLLAAEGNSERSNRSRLHRPGLATATLLQVNWGIRIQQHRYKGAHFQ